LAQALVIGHDSASYLPTIPIKGSGDSPVNYLFERFISDDRILNHDFNQHSFIVAKSKIRSASAICPEAELRQSLFTELFTG